MRTRVFLYLRLAVAVFTLALLFLHMNAQGQGALAEQGLLGNTQAGLTPAPNGRLYGVTYEQSGVNMGTLYSVDSALLTPPVVHVVFTGANGSTPYDELTYDAATGKFYGTTDNGTAGGTIFSYVPGANAVTTLRTGISGRGPLVITGGFIFGTTRGFAATVYRMATDGSGFTTLHTFDPITFGVGPGPLTLGANGMLYGVTSRGGIACVPNFPSETCGTVFRIRAVLPTDIDQNPQFQTLYEVQTSADSGLNRQPVYGSDGLLYFNHHRRIYRLDPQAPNPSATLQTIWEEPGGSISMSIVEGSDNRLYAASYGNTQSQAGSVFSIERNGMGKIVHRLFSFLVGTTAYGPYGRLYRTGGTVYGTTEYTISGSEYGTVFAIGAGSNSPPDLSSVAVVSPVTENGTTTLSGVITDPNASDTFTLTVNWGDGSAPQIVNYPAGTTSFSETHQYLDDNPTGTPADNYAISLTLADNNGATDTGAAVVTVNNSAPVLSNVTANPSTITAGQQTSFSGFVNDVGTLDPHQIVINWGDGSPNTTLDLGPGVNSFNTVHQFNVIGTYNVTVTATDDDTGSANAGATLTVNTPPVLSNIAITSPISENGTASLTGNITDPNAGDQFSLAVDWGDGGPVQFFSYAPGTTSFNETHQYRDDNPTGTPADNYTISLVLSDTRQTDTDSAMITVNNIAPVLTNIAANPTTINIGGTTNLSGNVTDVGTLDTRQIVINWGDGTPNTRLDLAAGVFAFGANHQYNTSGTFSVGVTATDDDTGTTTGGASVTVNASPQQPPVLSNVAVSSPIIENGTATLTGNISDPNAGDTFVLTVNWGDGSPPQMFSLPAGTSSFSRTHQYLDDHPSGTASDNYTIGLVLNDNAGGSANGSATVTVNNSSPVLNNITANPAAIVIGGTTSLAGLITDVGTLDTHQIVINWGDGTPNTSLNLSVGVDGFTANHQYNTAGTFNISVAGTDDDTGAAAAAARVTVNPNQLSPGKIAFASLRDGNYEIYSMNPDGSNQTRLTNNPANDFSPAISPDGNRIAFRSDRDGNGNIYLMNADGTAQTRLTSHPANDRRPSFSPDGSHIVFESDRDGDLDIFVMNSDGSNQTRLTNNPTNDFDAVFSPDGNKIAFSSQRDGFGQVYVMNAADGSNQTRLTNLAVDEFDPSFSPDGSRIAFTSFRHGATAEIYTMNAADGSNQTRLTDNAAGDVSAAFSPDGSQIAFASNRDGRLEVYRMNADGSGQVRLTDIAPSSEVPAWGTVPSPAAGRIVFTSNREGGLNFQIYSMNANGTDIRRLTYNPAADYYPSLSPDGRRIVFASNRVNNLYYEIYVMNADGTGQTALTNNASFSFTPSFSPDGKQITFVSFSNNGGYGIYVMNADGTNQNRLTNNEVFDASPSFSPDGNRIIFYTNRNGNADVYSMNTDGTNLVNLTNNAVAQDLYPSFSPDGSRIAFTSVRDGIGQIYVMNADGTGQTRVSNSVANENFPKFSPDGSQIVFTSYRDEPRGEIYTMNADGTNPIRLTRNPSDDVHPSWSITPPAAPGRKLVFHSMRDGNAEVYTMNSNGTNQTRITFDPAFDEEASFSPDGSRIVFQSTRGANQDIYVMNADGSNPVRLTTHPAPDFGPSFSPDGSRIVFASERDGNFEIYVMNADGSNQSRMTNNPAREFSPTFSPDGNRIAFYSERNAPGLYLMSANGRSSPTRLTFGVDPSFSPDGNRIVFRAASDLFVINTDGTNQTQITATFPNFDPAFSPDGSQIVFESQRDDNGSRIYIMNADGSNQVRLTSSGVDFSPSWGAWVLPAPTNLTATAVSASQINLTWADTSVGEDGFVIERCLGNNCLGFIEIARTGPNVTTFASAGLAPQTFYTYRVRSFGPGGNSPYSNTARDRTLR